MPQATSTLQTAANTKLDTIQADLAAEAILLGAVTETAPASDTASSGLNGRLQRIAQRLTSLIAGLLSATAMSDAARVPVSQLDGLAVSGSATSAAVLFTQDMLGYESIVVQVTSIGVGNTVTFEASADNTNWFACAGLRSLDIGSVAPQTTTTVTALLQFPRKARYFRARVSVYGSGTVTAVGELSKVSVSSVAGVNVANNSLPIVGAAAHDAAISGAPLRGGARALTANYTAVQTGDAADLVATLVGALIQKPFSIPEADWSYAAASGGEVGTADVPVKAAAAAGLRNYMTWLSAENVHATVDTEIVVKDGSTVIYRGFLKALGVGPLRISFPSPLKSTAATALNVANITTGAQVYFNCGGYVAP
ncbi:hypothetical protein [Mesorhizobium sp. M0910]|uniref:hypothetical protein n=1 Tax=Mesorhizobium sp. M0910 TaxID=2957025 RepID=UPI00333C70B7